MKQQVCKKMLSTLCIFAMGTSLSHAATSVATDTIDATKTQNLTSDIREVEAQYPYSALLKKSKSIKINYSESDKDIDCNVSILPKRKMLSQAGLAHQGASSANAQSAGSISAGTLIESSARTASKNHFSVAPLRACLSKTEARRLIAKL